MHFLTFVTLCCLATMSCCLSTAEEAELGDILQDLEDQGLTEELEGELDERQTVPGAEAEAPNSKLPDSLPKELPIKPWPWRPCGRACCDKRKTYVRLGTVAPGVNNGMPGVVTVLQAPTTSGNIGRSACNKRALLKVNFQKFAGCPFCGRYLLRIDLELSREARSTGARKMFNIGDSQGNDGFKGDYPPWNQRYDAESQSQNEDIWLYGNDNCPTRTYPGYNPYKFTNALSKYATHVTIYIGNEYIRVTNDRGYDRESCHRCWYALNGQNDSTGSENTDIFVALNRVVTNKSDRRGYGVCAATLSWVCGWNFSENYKD